MTVESQRNYTFPSFREVLIGEYSARRIRNPKYSLRAFALDLGLSSSSRISEILNGKQGLSVEVAREIAGSLKFDIKETEVFCDLVELECSRSSVLRRVAEERLKTFELDLDDDDLAIIKAYTRWCPIYNSTKFLYRVYKFLSERHRN